MEQPTYEIVTTAGQWYVRNPATGNVVSKPLPDKATAEEIVRALNNRRSTATAEVGDNDARRGLE